MNATSLLALPIAFLAGFLAIGIPYWAIPYNQVNVPDSLPLSGLLVIVLAAGLLRFFRLCNFLMAIAVAAASAPAAVFVRVAWDTAADSTSHNLWPIEIVLAGMTGLAYALTGAVLGSLLARFFSKPPTSKLS